MPKSKHTAAKSYAPTYSPAAPIDTKEKLKFNVRNLPLTSIALAGIVGAGALALFANRKK